MVKNQEIRIYSEIMLDADFAISVTYAGEADPETSHSTVEMHRVILELNLSFGKRINYFWLYKPEYYGFSITKQFIR